MTKRRFSIELMATATLELDEDVINAVDDEWRSDLYDLNTPEEIAEMIGRCMIAYSSNLSDLDGWADQPNENAKLIGGVRWFTESVSEIKP